MTRDELLHLQQALEAAGADRRLIVAVAEADQAWRVHLKAYRAVRKALASRLDLGSDAAEGQSRRFWPETESDFAAGPAVESDFSADLKSDSARPESDFPQGPDARKAVARKALLMTPWLRPAARRIGARLIDRFNLDTGRCDPSVALLARDEGLDPRSVRRAIGELVDAGLFARQVWRGRSHRNAYLPDWAALARLAAEVESAPSSGAADRFGDPGKSDSQNRTRATKPDGRVRQNHERESLPPERVESQGARQLSLRVFGQIEGGMERAIRGRHRGDHEAVRARLAAWWGLDDRQRTGFRDLDQFEAWLREQASTGPPRSVSGGG